MSLAPTQLGEEESKQGQGTGPAQGCQMTSGQKQRPCQRNTRCLAPAPSAKLAHVPAPPPTHDSGFSPVSPPLRQVKVWRRGDVRASGHIHSDASPLLLQLPLLDYLRKMHRSLPLHFQIHTGSHPQIPSAPQAHTRTCEHTHPCVLTHSPGNSITSTWGQGTRQGGLARC